MVAVYDAHGLDEERRSNIRTGVELVLQGMASDAARLRDTLFDREYRDVLTENILIIEEVRDQMGALLKVLGSAK